MALNGFSPPKQFNYVVDSCADIMRTGEAPQAPGSPHMAAPHGIGECSCSLVEQIVASFVVGQHGSVGCLNHESSHALGSWIRGRRNRAACRRAGIRSSPPTGERIALGRDQRCRGISALNHPPGTVTGDAGTASQHPQRGARPSSHIHPRGTSSASYHVRPGIDRRSGADPDWRLQTWDLGHQGPQVPRCSSRDTAPSNSIELFDARSDRHCCTCLENAIGSVTMRATDTGDVVGGRGNRCSAAFRRSRPKFSQGGMRLLAGTLAYGSWLFVRVCTISMVR